MACGQLRQLHAPRVQECGLSYEDSVWPVAFDNGKGRIDLAAGAGIENLDLQPDSTSSRFYGFQCGVGICSIDGIDEHGNALSLGHQLTQKFQSLRHQFGIEEIDPCQISARTSETSDQT